MGYSRLSPLFVLLACARIAETSATVAQTASCYPDSASHCSNYASYCEDPKWRAWMQRSCSKTCCRGGVCAPDSTWECAGWKKVRTQPIMHDIVLYV